MVVIDISTEDDIKRLRWEPREEPTVFESSINQKYLSEDINELEEIPLSTIEHNESVSADVHHFHVPPILEARKLLSTQLEREHDYKDAKKDELEEIRDRLDGLKFKKEYTKGGYDNELGKVLQVLKVLDVERIDNTDKFLKHIVDTKSDIEKEDMSINISLNSVKMNNFIELENRLDRLEKIVGNRGIDSSVSSLAHEINSIYKKILLIDDQNCMSDFSEKFSKLKKEYEDSLIGKQSKQDQEVHEELKAKFVGDDTRLTYLMKMYRLLDEYTEHFPTLVKRLESYNDIDNKVRHSYNICLELKTRVSQLTEQQNNWMAMLDKLEQKMEEQDNLIMDKLNEIERRL